MSELSAAYYWLNEKGFQHLQFFTGYQPYQSPRCSHGKYVVGISIIIDEHCSGRGRIPNGGPIYKR